MSENPTTAIATIQAKRDNVIAEVDKNRKAFLAALPMQHLQNQGARWLQTLENCIRRNPKLWECKPSSVASSAFLAAELGLDLTPLAGECALIPYDLWNPATKKKEMTCTLQPMYKGLMSLATRTNRVDVIYAHEVYANDVFELSLGTDKYIKHRPALSDRGEIIGYYAVAQLTKGDPVFEYMSLEDCRKHRDQYSKGYRSDAANAAKYGKANTNPWATNEPAMCKKTVVKKLITWLPKSAEDMSLERAAAIDTAYEEGIPLHKMGVDIPVEISGESVEVEPDEDGVVPDDPLDEVAAKLEEKQAARTGTAKPPQKAKEAAQEPPQAPIEVKADMTEPFPEFDDADPAMSRYANDE
jgi:recombination protein RecT